MLTRRMRRYVTTAAAVLTFALPLAGTAPKHAKEPYDKITSPEVAAKRLYEAWKKGDRKSANEIAAPEAVSKLFETKFRPLEPKRCDHVDEGFQCIYHDAIEDLFDVSFSVEGGASAGYSVTSVSFSSEED